MTKVDAVRVIKLIEALAQSNTKSNTNKRAERNSQSPWPSTAKLEPETYDRLRVRIRANLSAKPVADMTPEKMKKVVISEIILWEFGDDFVNSGDFREILDFVHGAISSNRLTESAFSHFVTALVER